MSAGDSRPRSHRLIIDFGLLKQLSPCRLTVILPTKDCGPIPEWFKQRKYPLVHVFTKGGQPIQVHDWASRIDTFEFEQLDGFEYHCGSATRAMFEDRDGLFIAGDKLESFEASGSIRGATHIPLNIKKLVHDSYTEIDVSKFPNLIHLGAPKPINVPSSQLQTYSGDAKPTTESLDGMVEFASVTRRLLLSIVLNSKQCLLKQIIRKKRSTRSRRYSPRRKWPD